MMRGFWVLVFLSPGIWWLVIQPQAVVQQWTKIPAGISRKVSSIFAAENLKPIISRAAGF